MPASILIPETCDGLRVPARFVARAYVDRFPDGSLRVTETSGAQEIRLDDYTAIVCDGGAYHYFHFMEAMIWLWCIQHEFLGGVPPARIVFANPWDNPDSNHVQVGVLAALYPGVSLVDPGWNDWPASFDNVLIYDRSWAGSTINKILEPCLGFARRYVMDMARRARRAVGAFGGVRDVPHFLHVPRTTKRWLDAQARADLLALLQGRGTVAEVDFTGLPWEQQVRFSAAHDVLLGVHGNGLTNALWMRPGSLVLEFFPPGARHYDYQLFAELCGLDYYGFEGDCVFPAFSRFGEPYGHGEKTNQVIRSVALGTVGRVVDAWIAKRV